MIEITKEIVIALINSKQIGNHNNTEDNLEDVKKAIKEIYQEAMNTKAITTKIGN